VGARLRSKYKTPNVDFLPSTLRLRPRSANPIPKPAGSSEGLLRAYLTEATVLIDTDPLGRVAARHSSFTRVSDSLRE
jgi:hypothetical protein